jgi:SpoU rRNA methylase family enzyme
MMDRLAQLIAEKARSLAAHDGVPPAHRHFHAAWNELTVLLPQARDHAIRRLEAAMAALSRAPEAAAAPAPEREDPAPAMEAVAFAPEPPVGAPDQPNG